MRKEMIFFLFILPQHSCVRPSWTFIVILLLKHKLLSHTKNTYNTCHHIHDDVMITSHTASDLKCSNKISSSCKDCTSVLRVNRLYSHFHQLKKREEEEKKKRNFNTDFLFSFEKRKKEEKG